jgi:hypothetical protein
MLRGAAAQALPSRPAGHDGQTVSAGLMAMPGEGRQHYEQQQRQRSIAALRRRAPSRHHDRPGHRDRLIDAVENCMFLKRELSVRHRLSRPPLVLPEESLATAVNGRNA